MKFNLIKIQAFFICVVPFALITGPFLGDLIVSLLALSFVYQSFKNRLIEYYRHPLIITLIFFNIFIIFRSLFSEIPTLSFESSLFYFRFVIFSLCVWYVLNKFNKLKIYFLYSLNICFLIIIIDSFIQYFTGNNTFGYSYSPTNIGSAEARLSSFFGEEKILGSYLSRLFPIFFALITINFSNSKPMVIFSLILLILVDLLVLFSAERTALFYLFFSSLIIILLIKKWKIFRIITLIISLAFFALVFSTNESVRYRVLDKTIKQTNVVGENFHAFSIQHQVVYESALRMFFDNPIFGIGPKLFREKCKENRYQVFTDLDHSINGCQAHPHNTYVQLLAETGLIGFIPIFVIFLYVLKFYMKHAYSIIFRKRYFLSDYQVCLLTAILISLWPLVPTGNVFNNWLSVIYFLPLGFFLNSFNTKNN